MATFAIFRNDGASPDSPKQLLCVCASRDLAVREVKERAEKHSAGTTALKKEMFQEHDLRHRLQVTQASHGKTYVWFAAEEIEFVAE